ncbi:adenylate/guanylate cyclase domain-containing protein [Rhodovibrionaceae bacterium A322]
MSAAAKITAWLVSEGRMLGRAEALIEGYVAQLRAAGVNPSRINIAQRVANPLLAAWGVVWTPAGTTHYEVPHEVVHSSANIGGPFDYVRTHKRSLHKSLVNLDPDSDHSAYLDQAEAGGVDFFAMPLQYGDGSVQGVTFVTQDPEGFSQEDLSLLEGTCQGLAAALEPVAMRASTASLLKSYLGAGPAQAVRDGSIKRGEHRALEAVVMFSDLRGFTRKTETWSEPRLLAALDGYFDCVVRAVQAEQGDVLKFMGDGILSIFPIEEASQRAARCAAAVSAAQQVLAGMEKLNETRHSESEDPLALGLGLNRGEVTYGNIGSPDRLDFTVLGSVVNVASRVEGLCKTLDQPVLATGSVAEHCPDLFSDVGNQAIRGVSEPLQLFALRS